MKPTRWYTMKPWERTLLVVSLFAFCWGMVGLPTSLMLYAFGATDGVMLGRLIAFHGAMIIAGHLGAKFAVA